MSNQSDYLEMHGGIERVDGQRVKSPACPVGIFLQEAEDLGIWVQTDRPVLEGSGFDWRKVEQLPKQVGACRYAESLWRNARQRQLQDLGILQDARELNDELVHHMLFAYRNHPSSIARVRAISENRRDADLAQNLSDLHVLGRENPEPLEAIHLDMGLLDKAAELSDLGAATLAEQRGSESSVSQAKEMRDKAYTLVKETVDEIRQRGRYLFWRTPDRLKGYSSRYRRSKGRRNRRNGSHPVDGNNTVPAKGSNASPASDNAPLS